MLPSPVKERSPRNNPGGLIPVVLILLVFLAAGFITLSYFGLFFGAQTEPVSKKGERDSLTVVLDPGHGGEQPGCIVDGIMEKDITLPLTMKVADLLKLDGYTVILTREDDSDVTLAERAALSNESEADCFVSIHCNSFRQDEKVHGLESYYYLGSLEGKSLAEQVNLSAEENGIFVRYAREEDFHVIRETKAPAVLVETGYMTNPDELKLLLDEDYRDKLAVAIVQAVEAYLQEKTA